eukprot:CAMPEP_0172437012 /NCGR_PEP_ID=MMETSP1064-20121228/72023_1 /TAXON_ID=202472 /ORGANISM="Aulacoseira subarctica , Strain CCAP 1002/5" /LENGTH=594 /DNA_ID=CAMNT_0013185445 /DNA_START=1221 /DNA_END=3005 /DNA_ORIENTATION=+
MQDLKKQTAMRLMNQQQNKSSNQESCYSPNVNQSVTSSSSLSSKQQQPLSYAYRGASRQNDRCSPRMHEMNDDASSNTSCSVHSLPGPFSGSGYSPRSRRSRPQKLPHGLTVHELKELTAARLAQEAIELSRESHSPRPLIAQQAHLQKNPSQVRQQNCIKSRRSHRSTSSHKSSSIALPDTAHSPTSLAVDRELHQSNLQHAPGPNSSMFSPGNSNENSHSLFVRPKFDSSKTPEEVPLRSRHWSVDSVSTLGSDYFGSERSPFATPYRKAGSSDLPLANSVFEIGSSRSFADQTDDLGLVMESRTPRSCEQSHDLLPSPNPSFSERHDLRSPFLSTPFWPVQEDTPSVQSDLHRNFGGNENMEVSMAFDAHFSGFDDYRESTFGSSLSLPATDGELPYVGQERKRPLQPIALHRQVSLAGELPNWVAESVLVTPQREIRKIYSDDKSVRSDSAIGSSSIFRPWKDERSPASTAWIKPTSSANERSSGSTAWIKPTSSADGYENRPNSFSFGAFDSLADGLGATLNLGPNLSNQDIFHRPSIESPKSSAEEAVPLAEIENSLLSAPTEQISRNSGSFWSKKGFGWRKKDGSPE